MNKVQNFLNEFLTAEAEVSNKYRQPDLEAYNAAVDQIANYTSEELSLSFGAKLVQLRDASDYERVKNYPPSIPRHVFRIDQYSYDENKLRYSCYVSDSSPETDWYRYFELLIIEEIHNRFTIVASFILGRNAKGEDVWTLKAGRSLHNLYTTVEDERYGAVLNEKGLGKQLDIYRLKEPSNRRSKNLYNQD